jgi:hypothetical protein
VGKLHINVFTIGSVGPLGAGSCVSTGNLMRILGERGHVVHSFKVGAKTERKTRVPKHGGYVYRIVSMEDAMKLVMNPAYLNLLSHLTIAEKELAVAVPMIDAGCAMFLRATKDAHPDLVAAWKRSGSNILTIREHVSRVLKKEHGLPSTAVPHVYIPSKYVDAVVPKKHHAVTINRVAHNKRMDIVLDANSLLPPSKRIHIYGVESRQYTHFKLDAEYPGWRETYYHGQFRIGEGARIAKKADYVVDMSDMGDDGGGTQNTFLEAWEAGCVLILNSKWYRSNGPVTKEHALFVDGAEELAQALHVSEGKTKRLRQTFRAPVRGLLASRSPDKIVRQLVKALRK